MGIDRESPAPCACSPQRSRRIVVEDFLERILSSRMVRRWKGQEVTFAPPRAKSRRCVRGHQDPDPGKFETYAPTLQTETIMCFSVMLRVLKMELAVADWKHALCQSSALHRPAGREFVEPCSGVPMPKGALIRRVYCPGLWAERCSALVASNLGTVYGRNGVSEGAPRPLPLCTQGRQGKGFGHRAYRSRRLGHWNVRGQPPARGVDIQFRFWQVERQDLRLRGQATTTRPGPNIRGPREMHSGTRAPVGPSKHRIKDGDAKLTEEEFKQLRSLIDKLNWDRRGDAGHPARRQS